MTSDLTLLIDPVTHHFEKDAMFDKSRVPMEGAEFLERWTYLRSWFQDRGIKVHTADCYFRGEVRSARYVFISFGQAHRYRQIAHHPDFVLSAFFAMESPIVEPTQYYTRLHLLQNYFKRIFTFTDIAVFAPFLRGPVRSQLFHLPYMYESVNPSLWAQSNRKFLVMINHNKLPAVSWNELFTERMRAVEFFAGYKEIDLYGLGWDGPSFQLGQLKLPGTIQTMKRALQKQWQRLRPVRALQAARQVYQGAVRSKLQTLAQYKSAICFENVAMQGWVTEKIFDCFVTGTIPIYLGAPDITNYVPAGCFIDMRQFSGYAELRDHLKSLGKAEIRRYRESGREFIASEQFRPFTRQHFTERIARIIEEDAGVSLCETVS
jgi:alpha(1,3/1,4) fucosyltransferase